MAQRARILVVEDEDLVRQLIVAELEDAGYEVVEAANGAQALAALSGPAAVDLLFTDIRLPGGLDGWGIAEAARRARSDVKVVYTTGFTPDQPQQVPGSILVRKPYRSAAVIEQFRNLGIVPG